jgi:phage shock protein PspC (stress-responsive transcriptional regulator)
MIAGVAGGIGEYLNVDATVVRIIFVILAFFHGTGMLLYLILAFLIPARPEG